MLMLSMLRFFVVVHVVVVWSFTATAAASAVTTTITSVEASSINQVLSRITPSSGAAAVTTPSPSPLSPSSSSTSTSKYIGPSGSNPICNICSNGTSTTTTADGNAVVGSSSSSSSSNILITKPDAILTFYSSLTSLSFTCWQLYTAGVKGQIKTGWCHHIQDPKIGVADQCGCITNNNGNNAYANGPQTDTPSESPTTSLVSLFPSIIITPSHVTMAIPTVLSPSITNNNSNNNNNTIKTPTTTTSAAATTKMGAITSNNNNCISRVFIILFWTMLVVVATHVTTSANW